MMAPSVCHGPPTSRCTSKRQIAPCGRTIRNCTASGQPGDSWSASLRFIQCKKCRVLGKAGKFALARIPTYLLREQVRIRWREQLGLPL